MRQPLSLPVLLLAALLAAPSVQAEVSMEGWPQWAQDAMEKELRKRKLREVQSGDELFRSKLPGKPADPEEIDSGWYFSSDIRAEAPLECYVFKGAKDLATLTNAVAEVNMETVAGNYGALIDRWIFHTDSGSIDGVPYLALEWLYTVSGESSQSLVAFTKVRAATKGDVAYACAHNYLGYRDTFAYAFTEFVANAEYDSTIETPYYEEIAKLDFGGLGTGIAYASYTVDEEGDTRLLMNEAMLTAVDASTLNVSDAVTVMFMTADGTMINTYTADIENGEMVSQMQLQRGETDDWIVSGTMQGKTIDVAIDGALSPASQFQQMAMARDVFTGTEHSLATNVWVPSVDPTQFLEARITRDDAEVERQAQLQLGPITYSGIFNDDGNMSSASVVLGPITIGIETIWSRGSLAR